MSLFEANVHSSNLWLIITHKVEPIDCAPIRACGRFKVYPASVAWGYETKNSLFQLNTPNKSLFFPNRKGCGGSSPPKSTCVWLKSFGNQSWHKSIINYHSVNLPLLCNLSKKIIRVPCLDYKLVGCGLGVALARMIVFYANVVNISTTPYPRCRETNSGKSDYYSGSIPAARLLLKNCFPGTWLQNIYWFCFNR